MDRKKEGYSRFFLLYKPVVLAGPKKKVEHLKYIHICPYAVLPKGVK